MIHKRDVVREATTAIRLVGYAHDKVLRVVSGAQGANVDIELCLRWGCVEELE